MGLALCGDRPSTYYPFSLRNNVARDILKTLVASDLFLSHDKVNFRHYPFLKPVEILYYRPPEPYR